MEDEDLLGVVLVEDFELLLGHLLLVLGDDVLSGLEELDDVAEDPVLFGVVDSVHVVNIIGYC